jgi:hypothetical protein
MVLHTKVNTYYKKGAPLQGRRHFLVYTNYLLTSWKPTDFSLGDVEK